MTGLTMGLSIDQYNTTQTYNPFDNPFPTSCAVRPSLTSLGRVWSYAKTCACYDGWWQCEAQSERVSYTVTTLPPTDTSKYNLIYKKKKNHTNW
jgi:hypothetical protein